MYTRRLIFQILLSHLNRWHNPAPPHTRTSWTDPTLLHVSAHFSVMNRCGLQGYSSPLYIFTLMLFCRNTLPGHPLLSFLFLHLYFPFPLFSTCQSKRFLKLRERKANMILVASILEVGVRGGVTFFMGGKGRKIFLFSKCYLVKISGISRGVTYISLPPLPNRMGMYQTTQDLEDGMN